jgi:hypothetical protein
MADQKPDLKLVPSVAQVRNDAIAEIRNGNADAADLVSRYESRAMHMDPSNEPRSGC